MITLPDIQSIPPWAERLFWSIATIAAAWGIGHSLNAFIISRISTWAARSRGTWDEAIIQTIQPRLPRWSLLVGVWLSLSYWPLTGQARVLLDQTLFVLIVVSVTIAAATLSSRLVSDYGARLAPAIGVTTLSRNITWTLVASFGLLAVLNHLGVSITPLVTAFGVGGLAVALALQDPLAQFFAGLTISLARQVRVGNYVRLDSGIEGEVVDFNWRVTRIRMATGKIILVPNARLAQSIVTNYSLPTSEVPVAVDLGVDLSTDLEAVERIASDVGREVIREVARRDATPIVRYHTFGNSLVKFTVWLVANDLREQALVVHEFMKRIDARFRERGIAIRM